MAGVAPTVALLAGAVAEAKVAARVAAGAEEAKVAARVGAVAAGEEAEVEAQVVSLPNIGLNFYQQVAATIYQKFPYTYQDNMRCGALHSHPLYIPKNMGCYP